VAGARDELLAEEKELTRSNDEPARKRGELRWVPVAEEYSFETADGTKSLGELFDGRSQLLVYNVVFGPECVAGRPVWSPIADNLNANLPHSGHAPRLDLLVERTLDRLQGEEKPMGWSSDWV